MKQSNPNDISQFPLINETLTLGIILKGKPVEIQAFLECVEEKGLQLVYKTLSYGKLFVVPGDEKK